MLIIPNYISLLAEGFTNEIILVPATNLLFDCSASASFKLSSNCEFVNGI